MKAAKEKKLSGIVCYRLDRISRNVGDFSFLIDELAKTLNKLKGINTFLC